MAATKKIRSISRAIDILRYLQEQPASNLTKIAKAVGLSKSTTLRILLTLHDGGLVRRGLADGLYRVSTGLNFRGDIDAASERLAEIGAPILDDVRRRIGWPLDLAVRRGAYMIAIESSRSQSPFQLSSELARLGEKINILASASGRAYLASCPPAELEQILHAAARQRSVFSRLATDRPFFDRQMKEVRRDGYAARATGFHGQTATTGDRYDDGLESIAVPVARAGTTFGSLILFWSRPAATIEEIVDAYLTVIQEAAAAIAGEMVDWDAGGASESG